MNEVEPEEVHTSYSPSQKSSECNTTEQWNDARRPQWPEGAEDKSGEDSDSRLQSSTTQRLAESELDDVPEFFEYQYDVSERVRQLNKELASEPLPDEDERRRSIKFKDTLVDLVAPPYDYSDADENADENEEKKDGDSYEDDRVVVERDGGFELLTVEELSPDEKRLYGIDDTSAVEKEDKESEPQPNGSQKEQKERSTSAKSARVSDQKVTITRPQSASYVSPYTQTTESRRALRRNVSQQTAKRHEEEAAQKREDERKHDGNEAFEAWLRKKMEQRRQTAREGRQPDAKAEENRTGYDEWLKGKLQQQRQQAKEELRLRNECNERWYIRPRAQCDHAFKDWLKRKDSECARTRLEKQGMGRLSCKVKLQTVRKAQSLRYVDYYGYRF